MPAAHLENTHVKVPREKSMQKPSAMKNYKYNGWCKLLKSGIFRFQCAWRSQLSVLSASPSNETMTQSLLQCWNRLQSEHSNDSIAVEAMPVNVYHLVEY